MLPKALNNLFLYTTILEYKAFANSLKTTLFYNKVPVRIIVAKVK